MNWHSGAEVAEGPSSIGPLHRLNGKTLGWPGDLLRIDGRIYGIDVGARLLYILDEDTPGDEVAYANGASSAAVIPLTRRMPGAQRRTGGG